MRKSRLNRILPGAVAALAVLTSVTAADTTVPTTSPFSFCFSAQAQTSARAFAIDAFITHLLSFIQTPLRCLGEQSAKQGVHAQYRSIGVALFHMSFIMSCYSSKVSAGSSCLIALHTLVF